MWIGYENKGRRMEGTSNVSYGMGRHMNERDQDNVGIWEDKNSEICMGLSVCTSKCED